MADRVTRHDKAPVRMGARPVEVRANGAKVYEGTAAFGDIVKRYPDLRPPRNEFIPAEEAMSEAALASLRGAVFTAGPRARDWDGRVTLPANHAPDLTTPDTVGDQAEGAVLDAWRFDSPDAPYPELKVKVIAYTRAIQDLIESGVCDLSLGMHTSEDWTSGVGPHCGTPFQCIQRNVIYDHCNLVKDARSRTPDGRTARLDASGRPIADDTYPHHVGETPIMNPEVLALPAKSMKLDALSAEDAALLAQMSPEAQAMLKAAAEGAVAAEVAAVTPVVEADDDAAEAASFAAVMARLAKLEAAMSGGAAAKPAAPKKDGAPTPDLSEQPDPATLITTRQDSTMVTDPAAIIAAATKSIQGAAVKSFNDAARFVGHVRKDGYDAVHTTDDAATVMLATIKQHLPLLAPTAEGFVKAQRLDSLTPLYDQAEALRRADLTRQSAEDVAGIVTRLDGNSGDAANFVVPSFSMPTRGGAASRS